MLGTNWLALSGPNPINLVYQNSHHLPIILQYEWQPGVLILVWLVLGSFELDLQAFGPNLEAVHGLDGGLR